MQFIDYYYYEYQTAPSPFASFLSLLLGVAGIVACWLLFKKAGKPGWASIVPFYNVYTIFEITWGSGWRFLMLLIPIYNIVLGIQTCIKLAKAFGKSGGFAAGLVFGILLSRIPRWLSGIIIPILSIFQTIPGLVFIGVLFIWWGNIYPTVIVALSVYAMFPVLKNT